MTMVSISRQSWKFVPPLDLPITLRLENGRFQSLRPTPIPGRPRPCTTRQIIPATDPRNPTNQDIHYANQIHEAVDLAATAGDCVFAAYSGRVVHVESDAAGTRGNITIDHHPPGLGFITKYLHITDIAVSVGEFVQKGIPFAAVSADPAEPHLHFELHAVVNTPNPTDTDWPGDSDLMPIDPTRALYTWEQQTAADEEMTGGPLVPQSVGLVYLNTVPFFTAAFDTAGVTNVLHVPMYEPVGADERLTIRLLRHANAANQAVTVRSRRSTFWGVDIITQVQLA
jgi:peptidase M23-like protein